MVETDFRMVLSPLQPLVVRVTFRSRILGGGEAAGLISPFCFSLSCEMYKASFLGEYCQKKQKLV